MTALQRTSRAFRAMLLIAALALVGLCALILMDREVIRFGAKTANPLPTRTLMIDLPIQVLTIHADPDSADQTKTLVAIQLTWTPGGSHQSAALSMIAISSAGPAIGTSGLAPALSPVTDSAASPVLPLSVTADMTGWVSFEVEPSIYDGTLIATFDDGSRQAVAIHW